MKDYQFANKTDIYILNINLFLQAYRIHYNPQDSSDVWTPYKYLGASIYDVHRLHMEGVRLSWMPADGWEGVRAMWTSTQKIRAHWRHSVFFSSKEVGAFLDQNFVFGLE